VSSDIVSFPTVEEYSETEAANAGVMASSTISARFTENVIRWMDTEETMDLKLAVATPKVDNLGCSRLQVTVQLQVVWWKKCCELGCICTHCVHIQALLAQAAFSTL
jgi:hypothetical protein